MCTVHQTSGFALNVSTPAFTGIYWESDKSGFQNGESQVAIVGRTSYERCFKICFQHPNVPDPFNFKFRVKGSTYDNDFLTYKINMFPLKANVVDARNDQNDLILRVETLPFLTVSRIFDLRL